jgi:chitinase
MRSIVLILFFGFACVDAGAAERVVAYVASWKVPQSIHAQKVTHLNVAFAHIDKDHRVFVDSDATIRSLVGLKQQNPKLKILLSVGGWQAEGFSDAALSEASRRTFTESAVKLLDALHLDGLDVDWEYPGNGIAGIQYRPEDKQNFTLLLRALREAFGNRYLLTIAAADREFVENIDLHQVPECLDWINLMSYDFFNSVSATTGHHAGLYRAEHALPRDRNADSAVSQYLAAGVPPEKIVLGVAFYGRGFAGVTARNNGVNQPYEHFEGEHSYADLAERFIGKQGFERYWDNRAQAPYLWNATARMFITYDDPQSLAIKARYVLQHRLGGIMFWELSDDRDDELLDVIDRGLQH